MNNAKKMTRRKKSNGVQQNISSLPERFNLEGDFCMPLVPCSTYSRFEFTGGYINTKLSKYKEEWNKIILLIFLYTLQGVPLGLCGCIPILMQRRFVNYNEHSLFSLAYWPFSIKLIWTPIIESVYISFLGRRKSWLVFTQYIIGGFFVLLSFSVEELLYAINKPPDVLFLSIMFFILNIFVSSQNIALSGWAISMLSREKIGLISACNIVGQTAGYFLGNGLFLLLENPLFCNRFLRVVPQMSGMVTLSDYLYFWGIVILIATTAVLLFINKKEDKEDVKNIGCIASYKLLFSIIKLPAVKKLIWIYLTCKIGFSTIDGLFSLRLLEIGIPNDHLSMLGIISIPLQLLLPFVINKFSNGYHPVDFFLKNAFFRLLLTALSILIIYFASLTLDKAGVFPYYLYLFLLISYILHQLLIHGMFVSMMSFNSMVSNPIIEGTYMTLLTTFFNIGSRWPVTLSLWLIMKLTWKICHRGPGYCANSRSETVCHMFGGTCKNIVDGFHMLSAVCLVIGLLWYYFYGKELEKLKYLPRNAWRCTVCD